MESITHPHTGKRFPLKVFFYFLFVVYLSKWPCGLVYVGETTQRIQDRISKHRSTIRCQNTLLPVPYHFIQDSHSISQMRFQVIESVPIPGRGGNRVMLLKKKSFWNAHAKYLKSTVRSRQPAPALTRQCERLLRRRAARGAVSCYDF